MLVLSRHRDETVKIVAPDGTVIDVMIVDIRSNEKVRLGIKAPQEYTVHRDEVYQAIQREKGETC